MTDAPFPETHRKPKRTPPQDVYVGFLDGRPHVFLDSGAGGSRVYAVFASKTAAKRAYEDVRNMRLVETP